MKRIILLALALVSIVAAKKHAVEFKYSPNVVPQSVHLAGSFNNWSTSATPMSDPDGDGILAISLELEDGEYQYKFVVNSSQWFQDMNNPLSAPDGYGGRNSIIRVGDFGKFQQTAFRGDGKILEEAVYHEQAYPYFVYPDSHSAYIRLRTKQGDVDSALALLEGTRRKMDWYTSDGTFDYYLAYWDFDSRIHAKIQYSFIVFDGSKSFDYNEGFFINHANLMIFHIPDWISNAIFYQIFPERFANGDKSNDPADVCTWGGAPEYHNFFGGDLKGVLDNLDYLAELGINAIYFNPIFLAPSNHKYDMADPMKIDPHFGDSALFARLLHACHARGIKVVLDMVYHDTGRQHWAFQDVIANGEKSQYRSWYNVYSFPVGPEDKPNYECWWGFGALPSLMTTVPDVRKYLFDVTKYWTRMGIDGWRLDCPNEVEDDFWLHFRDTVRAINPECYILGEIWGDGSNWLRGDMFDAVMNYRFREACIDFFALDKINARDFLDKYFYMLSTYLPNVNGASFNLLGSHDTPRFLTICGEDKRKLKLAWLFQMTTVGAPSIYYGDEIGMTGGKDPDCRRCFMWDTLAQDRDLLRYMRNLIAARKKNPVLAKGNIYDYEIPDDKSLVLHKEYNRQNAVIIINNGGEKIEYRLRTPSRTYYDVLENRAVMVESDIIPISVPAKSGKIIISEN